MQIPLTTVNQKSNITALTGHGSEISSDGMLSYAKINRSVVWRQEEAERILSEKDPPRSQEVSGEKKCR